MDLDNIWKSFLEKIKEKIDPMLYETWFIETKLFELDNGIAKISVPMHIHKKHLKENYNDLIVDIFSELTGSIFKFEYYTDDEIETNVEINTDNLGVPAINSFESNLKPEYTFETFIVGESNKFAHASALAVAEQPGLMYNPLFIYGKSGLGKTHLMHAIGNYITKHSKKKVLYVTSEQFVDDFICLYRKNKEENNINDVKFFKSKYRDIDVLMIDDIQYLQIASKTQQEFFNTFNELYSNNKQIVITSDRSPDDLKSLEERLQTRFSSGLTEQVSPPDFQLRMDIIDKKIEGNDMVKDFPDDVKEYIASNCTSNIRKLEGTITRVVAYSTMMGYQNITLDVAIEALKDYFVKTIISKNKIDMVQQLVAETYNITVDDLKSKKRTASVAVPRHVAMYICRVACEESFPKIGMEFGGKNHTTVMHSVEKIKKEIQKDNNLDLIIKKIISQIK